MPGFGEPLPEVDPLLEEIAVAEVAPNPYTALEEFSERTDPWAGPIEPEPGTP